MDIHMRFAEALEKSAGELSRDIAKRATEEIGDYARLTPTEIQTLTANNHKHLTRFAESIRTDNCVSDTMGLAFALSYSRAQSTFPLSSVLRIWQIATNVIWAWFIDTVHNWGITAYRNLWPLWLSYADNAAHESVQAYNAWERANQHQRNEMERRVLSQISDPALD